MEKYSVKVNVNINGVAKEITYNNVYAKNEGHACWCAMARAEKINGYKGSWTCNANAVKVA